MKTERLLRAASSVVSIFLVSVMALPSGFAEGTKEIFSDLGLWTGDPPGSAPMVLYQWSFYGPNGLLVDAVREGVPGTPEGRQALGVFVTNRWGGCGFFFRHEIDPVVVDRDCSAYTNGHLRFWLKSTNQLTVEIECATVTGATQKGAFVARSTTNEWMEFVVPLSSFNPPLNLQRIRGPFLITAGDTIGRKTFYVDHVRWTKPIAGLEIYPSSATVKPGQHLQFTVEGRSAAGESVILYSTFTASNSVGIMNPTAPALTMNSVLTAADESGSVSATALVNPQPLLSVIAVATVTVSSEVQEEECALLRDAIPACVTIETDSELFSFYGGSAELPGLFADTNDFREGTESLRTVVSHPDAMAYSGWTIQNGRSWTTDAETKDMSRFYDDYLCFAFKGDAQLDGKVIVGIRSGNVPAGYEYSKVWLTNYAACDGQWHSVTIPVRVLAGPRPWADLARIKNLFTISVVGTTSGLATFHVDNVRWGSLRPRFKSISGGPAGPLQLCIETIPGVWHVVERSSDLVHWTSIFSGFSTDATIQIADTVPGGSTQSFYRASRE